jgi:hypothetical protein
MEVLGGGRGVVLTCDTPIMVRWDDGVYIVLSDDKSVIYFDPKPAKAQDAQNYLQEILDQEARRGRPTMRTRIDEKHHIDPTTGQIVKTSNGQPIPDEEPRILFRGRDKLAFPMLEFYRQLCVEDGCTDYQLESVDRMIAEFREFAELSDTMKQPGITRGL